MSFEISDEVRTLYFQRRCTELEECRKALRVHNFKFLRKVGHDLKGNAETFGFAPMSEFGDQLESAALEKNMSHAERAVNTINEYLKSI